MLTLGINTATSLASLALFDHGAVLREESWRGNYDESERLLPALTGLLKSVHVQLKDVRRIVVVIGPGPFSAVRIGCTVANTLSYILSIPVHGLSALDIWKLRRPDQSACALVHAGGNFVARSSKNKKWKVFKLSDALASAPEAGTFYGTMTSDQIAYFKEYRKNKWKFIPEARLASFGEVVCKIPQKDLQSAGTVTPIYFRPPHITKPKKCTAA